MSFNITLPNGDIEYDMHKARALNEYEIPIQYEFLPIVSAQNSTSPKPLGQLPSL